MAYFVKNLVGAWGEKIACAQYLKKGYVLVARNVYNNRGKMLGELDLVMRTDYELVFVEVKTRRTDRFGTAVASVTQLKQRKLIHAVHWFQRRYPQYSELRPRIDVCAIDIDPLDKSAISVTIIPSAVTLDY